jgi:hypothetical protein
MFKRNATIATNEVLEVAAATVSRSAKWRKALVPLTTLAAAGALAIGSGADFSSQTANPNSIVASGTLTQSNSKANAAIFNVNNLKPGDIVNGDVTITNTGSLPAVMSLTEGTVASTFVNAANLSLVVSDGTNTVYTGNFGAMGTKSLGTFTAGQAKTYRFTVTFAQSADNSEQGKTASATYTWNGAQTSQVTITQGPAAATATPQAAQ